MKRKQRKCNLTSSEALSYFPAQEELIQSVGYHANIYSIWYTAIKTSFKNNKSSRVIILCILYSKTYKLQSGLTYSKYLLTIFLCRSDSLIWEGWVHLTCCSLNPWIVYTRKRPQIKLITRQKERIQMMVKGTYNTASACIRPITDGIFPERRLPCKDLTRKFDMKLSSLQVHSH